MVIEKVYGLQGTGVTIHQRFTLWAREAIAMSIQEKLAAEIRERKISEKLLWQRTERDKSSQTAPSNFHNNSFNLNRKQVARRSRPFNRRAGIGRHNYAAGQQIGQILRGRGQMRGRGLMRGRGPMRGRGQIRGRGLMRGRGHMRGRGQMRGQGQMKSQTWQRNQSLQGRSQIQKRQVARRGRPFLRGRGIGRGGVYRQPVLPSKEQLDKELDQYMASSKAALDRQLDEYMSEAVNISVFG